MKNKIITFILFLVFSQISYAGLKSGYNNHIEIFTSSTVYKSVYEETGGFNSKTYGNLSVYDLQADSSKLLFDGKEERSIRVVMFEKSYDEKEKKMEFAEPRWGSFMIANNEGIERRAPKNKLLIVVYRPDTEINELWISDLSGTKPELITSDFNESDLRLDVKNEMIRILETDGLNLKIKSYKW